MKILGAIIGIAVVVIVVIGLIRPSLLRQIFTSAIPSQEQSMVAAESVATTSAGNFRFMWGVSGVGPSNNNEADGVAVDDAGNVYASGIFSNTIDIGNGLLTLTSRGEGDIFVMKFDKQGKLLWHRQYGNTGNDNTFDIDLDPSGNIVLNGWFTGTVDFGGITLQSQGSQDQFLMKMSPDGEVLWAKDFGGTEGDGGNEVTVDTKGNIFATALSVGTFTAGSFSFQNYGARDSYVMKVSPSGEVLWVRGTEGSGNERVRAIGLDSEGNVFGGYEFSGELKVRSATYQGKGGLEGAIVKWDTSGKELWSDWVTSSGNDDVRGITGGPSGSFYVTGFNAAGADVFGKTLASAGGTDAYLAKFNRNNQLEWMMTLASSGDEDGGEIDSDNAGNVAYSTDAEPNTTIKLNGQTVRSLSLGNKKQALLLRLDPNGTILSTNSPSASTQSSGNTLGVSGSGAYSAQVINFGGALTYGNQTFTATPKYKSFLITAFSSSSPPGFGPAESGKSATLSLTFNGVKRTYILHTPSGYDRSRQYPLMLSYHGAGGTGEGQEQKTGFDAVADENGFLVAYPSAVKGDWQLTGSGSDIEFTKALIAVIEGSYSIDSSRIYVSGFSAGGGIVQAMACAMTDTIAGMAYASNTLGPRKAEQCHPSLPVAVVGFSGTEDVGGEADTRNNYSYQQTAEFWVSQNGCSPTPATTYIPDILTDGRKVTDTKQVWSGCKNGVTVTLYTIEGGGHAWPGGVPSRNETDTKVGSTELDASTVIWDTLSIYKR